MNEKELLLKDLSARAIYHPVCSIYREDDLKIGWRDAELTGYFFDGSSYEFYFDCYSSVDNILKIKPYLRPMSSMTEEEHKEYEQWLPDGYCIDIIDWLNKNHFDYRGLIPKGLALKAPKDMYKLN